MVWRELDAVSNWVLFAFLQGCLHPQSSITFRNFTFSHVLHGTCIGQAMCHRITFVW